MIAPTLETNRLILRAHVPDDFDFVARMWANPEVVRFIGAGLPVDRSEAWLKFLRFPGHWAMVGFGSWAIEEKASGAVIGEVGFIERNLPADNPLAGVPELGYGVVPEAFGKGYVTEAVRCALAWGREHFGPARVIAVIAPGNSASARVAERCGFARAPDLVSGERSLMLFERIL